MSEISPTAEATLSYDAIAALDPLDVDDIMVRLPYLNDQRNVTAISATLQEAIDRSQTAAPSAPEAVASLRDLDFLLASLLRHGVDPLAAHPALETELVRLGRLSNTVPRGTVFTYAAANPADERQRTFTGTASERSFIQAVREGIVALDEAVDVLGASSLDEPLAVTDGLQQSARAMGTMVRSIVAVHQQVTPAFFTGEMRPYFEPLTVEGETLTGAGGAQMQLLALDFMLWGADERDQEYQAFFAANVRYLTPLQQAALNGFLATNGEQSVVSYFEQATGEEAAAARAAALDLLGAIRKFRYPHRKVARDNFNMRPPEALGSGLYNTAILDTLLRQTESAIARLKAGADA